MKTIPRKISDDALYRLVAGSAPVTQTCHTLFLGQEILTTKDTKDTTPEFQCLTNQALVTLVSLVVKCARTILVAAWPRRITRTFRVQKLDRMQHSPYSIAGSLAE